MTAVATEECRKAGPYFPVGDVDWVCRTHGDVVLLNDHPERPVIRKRELRCPVAEPRDGDPPHEFESRS